MNKSRVRNDIPLIIKVPVPQTSFNPGAVDTEIYCVNTTKNEFHVSTKSESFTTIDEESGETAVHGSIPVQFDLAPGSAILIANVEGWEWDGHVGIEIYFREKDSKEIKTMRYNFKESNRDYKIESMNLNGRVINPL